VLASGGDYYDAANEAELRRLLEAIQNGVDQNVDQPREAVRAVATQLAQARGTPTVPPGLTATAVAATGVPTPAAVTDEAPYAAQTACDHPYLPLRPGARWTYVSAAGAQTAQVTGVTGGPSTATATMTRDGAESLTWQCDDSGLWANTIPHEAQVFGLDPQINGWEWLSSAGAWLLPPAQLAPGAQWAFNLTFQDNDAMGTGGQIGEVESVQALAAVGTEPVAFAGGVVEALRIDSTFEVTAMGSAGPPGSATYWYARGIGLIRLEFARGAQTALFELQSYTVPQ
jgi:hypothetical protein